MKAVVPRMVYRNGFQERRRKQADAEFRDVRRRFWKSNGPLVKRLLSRP